MTRPVIRGSEGRFRLLVPGLILLAWGLTAFGAPIEVNNHSFEMPALGAGGWTNDLPVSGGADDPQWIGRDGPNSADTFIESIGGFFSEGSQHIGMANGYFVFQNLGVPYEPNTAYTLTVGVGYRNPTQSGDESFSVIGLTAQDEPPSDSNTLEGTDTNDQLDVDPVLAAASARVDSVALNDAEERTFTDVSVEFTTDENPPEGNIVIFLGDDAGGVRSHFDNVRLDAVTALDPDGDGIPEEWEVGTDRGVPRDLDPTVDDGGEDPDGDTLTNFQEFQLGTHPRLADTDGDGLNDNFEDSTDPLNPDVDGDTLLDGAEIATHQTDPNNPDTDGDDFEDQAEIAAGTDPLDADSIPTRGGAILLGGNFVGGNAESDGATVTATAGVVPQDNWNNLPGGAGGPIIANNSEGEPSLIRVSWETNGPGIAGDPPTAGDGDAELMHGILLPRGNGAGGDDVLTTITVKNIAYPFYDIYVYLNADAAGGTYGVNGELMTVSEVVPFDGSFVEVTEDGGSGNYIHFQQLTGTTLTISGAQEPDVGGGIAGFQFHRIEPGDPSLLAIPEVANFGVFEGNPGPQEMTLQLINPGASETLNITGSDITGDGAASYEVSGIPTSLEPSETAEITVTFTPPDDVGIFRGFLEITSNDAVVSTSRISLIGQIKHANGLLAHYKMDETEGTVMEDSSGNGFNGNYITGSGSVTLGAAALATGTSVALDEGDDAAYAEVPENIAFPTLAEATYSFWVQPDAGDVGTASVLFSRSTSAANPYAVFFEASEGPDVVVWTSEASTETLVSEPFIAPGETFHVVYTYSDSNEDGIADVALYVNGVLNASATGASGYPLNTVAPFQIGGTAGDTGLTGRIDDFQIYETVLHEEQIQHLFNNPGERAPDPPAVPILLGYWPFDDQETETADVVGGNSGTVNGGATFVEGHTGAAGDFAIGFDGVDDSVTTTVSLLNDQGTYTISGWINMDGEQPERTGLFGQNDLVEFGINGIELSAWTGPEGTLAADTDLTSGEWLHIATVSGESQRFLYINGVEVGQGDAIPADRGTSDFNFNIGGDGIWDDAGNWFSGQIDDVAVFSVALEPAEIEALASGAKTPLNLREPGNGGDPGDMRPGTIGAVTKSAASVGLSFPAGTTFDVEHSTDLQEWTVIATGVTGDFEDTDAGRISEATGFYRGVAQ